MLKRSEADYGKENERGIMDETLVSAWWSLQQRVRWVLPGEV